MPDLDDADDDERVIALQSVLKRNGIGGAAPFTIEGEIQQMGHVAGGVRRTGWRRTTAWVLVALVVVPLALAIVGGAIDAISRLFG